MSTSSRLDTQSALTLTDELWEREILPVIEQYIRIPNRSPAFDKDWRNAGHMDAAVALAAQWCQRQPIQGMTVEVVQLEGRTPLLYLEVPGNGTDTVLLYGHLDKQPEMTGWREGLGPWTPVREGDRLYGRGGADDGYAVFASLAAIRVLRAQNISFSRCVIVIECCEESGSYDLPAYIDALAPRIGTPSLVVCLDSGCGNYDQLWMTTSLRGLIGGDLRVQVLTEGVHSGDASGIVPSSFRIARQVLERIEDASTGVVKVAALHVDVPAERVQQAAQAAEILGDDVYAKFPWAEGMQPSTLDRQELVLRRTWRPALAITGVAGLPSLERAGNVLRPETTLKLSVRIPPTLEPSIAAQAITDALEASPPSGATVRFQADKTSTGWNAPPLHPWLQRSLDTASNAFFGRPSVAMGEGGTIPFMGMLGRKFPAAQFVITGVLGPHSNAHGPNEFLHIPTAKKLTCVVASVLADQFDNTNK